MKTNPSESPDHVAGGHQTQPPSLVVGQLAHVLIGDLLQAGLRKVDAKRIARAVRALPVREVASIHPYAVAQQLGVCAAIYLRLFVPEEPWILEGREVTAAGCRFDLVFASKRGRFVDQIKTGRLDERLEREHLDDQVQRELTAGRAAWSQEFRGVRTVVLGAPRKSSFFSADGGREPLAWEGADVA